MLNAFTFEHGGRTYTCKPESRAGLNMGPWWWFTVSYDQQSYAPFAASSSDTQTSVKNRVIAFYEHRLWAKEQPVQPRHGQGRPGRPPSVANKTNGTNGTPVPAPKK